MLLERGDIYCRNAVSAELGFGWAFLFKGTSHELQERDVLKRSG